MKNNPEVSLRFCLFYAENGDYIGYPIKILAERKSSLSEIYCGIDNCHYWDQGNHCKAVEILVAADSWAAKAGDNIDAPKHAQIPQMQANSCMETCCKTFVDKKDKIKADGVIKNP